MAGGKIRLGLVWRIVIAMALGVVCGFVLPDAGLRVLKTFDSMVSVLLKFVVPLVITGLVTAAIVESGRSAGRMLAVTFALVLVSVIGSGFFAYGLSAAAVPKIMGGSFASGLGSVGSGLKPYFTLQVPPVFNIMTALALAVVVGLAIVRTKSEGLGRLAVEMKGVVAWMLAKVLVPILPWYILAMTADMTAGGKIVSLFAVFACVIAFSTAVTLAYLLVMFTLAGAYTVRNPLKLLWTMKDAYVTAFATCSSAASIPVSLAGVKKCGVSEETAEFVVPMCATIHLSGSMIKLVCCAASFMFIGGGELDAGRFATFIMVMTATAIAAPGIPGGVITSSLGALASIMMFTPEQCSMMMTVYLAMDGVGSACSVAGHAPIALVTDKLLGRRGQGDRDGDRQTGGQTV